MISKFHVFGCLLKRNSLQICMNHILSVLKVPQDRDSGFIALGEMAAALDGELIHYLQTISTHLREVVCYSNCCQMPIWCHFFFITYFISYLD